MKPGTVRLNLDITEGQKETLEAIKARTEAGTLVEVFRRAISLYDIATSHLQDPASKIIFEDGDGKQTTIKLLL